MTIEVNILDAKNRLSELIKSAQAGEDVVIAKRGDPVARLVAISADRNAPRGSARSILEWLARRPLPDHARRSAEEIDAAIDDQRTSWD